MWMLTFLKPQLWKGGEKLMRKCSKIFIQIAKGEDTS